MGCQVTGASQSKQILCNGTAAFYTELTFATTTCTGPSTALAVPVGSCNTFYEYLATPVLWYRQQCVVDAGGVYTPYSRGVIVSTYPGSSCSGPSATPPPNAVMTTQDKCVPHGRHWAVPGSDDDL